MGMFARLSRLRNHLSALDVSPFEPINVVVQANVGVDPEARRPDMSDEYRKLSREELNEIAGEELPERAAMSLINANVAAPINAAVALNALSDNSTAYANATQDAPITQTN
jgi:hypothetical protein